MLKVAISAVMLSMLAGVAGASSCIVVRKAGAPNSYLQTCEASESEGGVFYPAAYPGVDCPAGWITAKSWTSIETGWNGQYDPPVNCVSYVACCSPNDVVQTALLAVIAVGVLWTGLLIRRTAGSRATSSSKIYEEEEGLLNVNR